jgi:hypothetical protein
MGCHTLNASKAPTVSVCKCFQAILTVFISVLFAWETVCKRFKQLSRIRQITTSWRLSSDAKYCASQVDICVQNPHRALVEHFKFFSEKIAEKCPLFLNTFFH